MLNLCFVFANIIQSDKVGKSALILHMDKNDSK